MRIYLQPRNITVKKNVNSAIPNQLLRYLHVLTVS